MFRRTIKLSPLVLLTLALLVTLVTACSTENSQTGTLEGKVTIGPIFPVERPGENPPVPPEVFESRKIMVYDENGKRLIKEVDIKQIGQTNEGYYSVELTQGTYLVDIKQQGIDRSGNVPKVVKIVAGKTVTVDIDIDTGIR